jgi:hypothetical protein
MVITGKSAFQHGVVQRIPGAFHHGIGTPHHHLFRHQAVALEPGKFPRNNRRLPVRAVEIASGNNGKGFYSGWQSDFRGLKGIEFKQGSRIATVQKYRKAKNHKK